MAVMLFSLVRMWILIHIIDNGEKVPDVIPNAWKIDQSSCWYPKNLKSNIINSLARKQIMPDHSSDDWEYCTMQIIETNISDFQIGLKMMVKLAKNAQNLHSDYEQRGRGKRTKSSKRLFDNLDSECSVDEDIEPLRSNKKKTVSFPVFPSNIKDNTNDETLLNIANCTPSRKTSLSSQDNISNEETLSTTVSTPTCSTNNISVSNVFECKLAKKSHSCTFQNCISNDKETLLVSIAHQLCKISAENKKITSNMFYIKQELNSFMESKKSSHCDEYEPTSSKENALAPFPLKNEDELMLIESKLKSEDLSFTNKLVTSFVFASEGKSVQKVTTNMLKTIFSYELASQYSWKGQKNKKKLHTLNIFKVIIEAVGKKFPNEISLKCSVIQSIQTWFARAPYQTEAVLKTKKKTENTGVIMDERSPSPQN
ncbi:unnamed protein product [Macrosiphum euphorbiae]|uniref:DUF4806 domain-containing protein n=1 Tax=Macrosiphum euphorbiae TaxID=13131 RepID=A0AAV0Y8G2_9HEMI|nr:unnamed protein product [Macrosiphum euphorbiae]